MTQNDIVQKLWNLCNVLRDDGINDSDYVTDACQASWSSALKNE